MYIHPLGASTIVVGLLVLFTGSSILIPLSLILSGLLRCLTLLYRPSGIDEWQLSSLSSDDWDCHPHSYGPRAVDVWHSRQWEAGAKGLVTMSTTFPCVCRPKLLILFT